MAPISPHKVVDLGAFADHRIAQRATINCRVGADLDIVLDDHPAELRDLADGEWTQFLCVEASNIMNDAITLAPRQEHTMTAILSVEKF